VEYVHQYYIRPNVASSVVRQEAESQLRRGPHPTLGVLTIIVFTFLLLPLMTVPQSTETCRVKK
jgi:hypothetical protein